MTTVHDDVADRIGAGIAQGLGDQEQNGAEGDQWADGIERAIHAVESGKPGEPEKRRGRTPIAGKGKSVLSRGETFSRGVKIGGGARAPCGPNGDA
jgi:hypothetical protein